MVYISLMQKYNTMVNGMTEKLAENIVKRGIALDMINLALVGYKEGNKEALNLLEDSLSELLGVETAKKIMEVINENINEEVPDILNMVDEGVLSKFYPLSETGE